MPSHVGDGDSEAEGGVEVDGVAGAGSVGEVRVRRRGVDERELARELRLAVRLVKPAKDLEDLERRKRLGRGLTRTDGGGSESGMAHYRMTLDPEGAAVLDAAVSALSAPRRLADGALEPGELTDPRSAATRRADALLDLVGRAVAAGGGVVAPGADVTGADVTGADVTGAACAGAGFRGEGGAGATDGAGAAAGPVLRQTPGLGEKAQVVVTIDYDALVGRLPGAGVTLSGDLLSAAVVRRMACDARILPMVLGAKGQVLDLGRARRLYSPGQRLVVWRRDRHCTYLGCSVPATWCDVHHAQWWSRGGGTDLGTAALLCRRHHAVVHERDLMATIDDTGVHWHASPW